MLDLIIRNGSIVRATGVSTESIGVSDGKIVEIAAEISGDAKENIDAAGLHVFPGLIDSHVHFNEPGRTEWEGFATGSSALAAGGGTCFFDMPLNSSPPVLDGESFDLKRVAAEKSSITDFALWGGLTPTNLDRMEELAERGVIGFKAFMSGSGIDDFERADDLTLYRGMKKAKQLGLPVAVHAESDAMTAMLSAEFIQAGKKSIADYLASRPIVAEVEATQRAIILAEETGCKLHIVHVSNSRCVELVRRSVASDESDTTCETCPHYLILNQFDVHRLGAPAKCAPPLRSPGENDEMWQDLAAGKFAFVASDHSPAPPTMKTGDDFFAIWGGIAGVQSTLSILLSRGPSLPLQQVAALTATNVAKRYAIPRKGSIELGFDADFALVNVAACYELRREHLLDRHKLSPYVGRTFHGLVRSTISRGRTVFKDGKITAPPMGRLVIAQRK
ncbi:MAG TPA: allantoinase AllB [Tepidisphaeraceae bacterium]|jgi:allantoinase|nr:allantoinase AllB [Tepidisphaeraceae bacterium]